MILVGEATEVIRVDKRVRVTFRCRNQEVFTLWQSAAINPFEPYHTLRLYVERGANEDNTASDEYIILHWEDLG